MMGPKDVWLTRLPEGVVMIAIGLSVLGMWLSHWG